MSVDYLVHRTKISPVFWESYIFTGYRNPDHSFQDSLRYIFVPHNDVGNFWTHFIILWVWLGWLTALSTSIDLTDPYWFPLLALWFGGCSYTLCSSLAHLFSCKSISVRQIMFMLDYLGISMYGFGASVAYFYYERPLTVSDWLFSYKWTHLALNVLITINSTLMCSMTRFFCAEHRYLLRPLSYILPYIMGFTPFNLRLLNCVLYGEERECIWQTIPWHFIGFFASLLLPFLFVLKIPERLYPGKFDYVFHSHQLFHLAAVVVTSAQFYVVPIDAHQRREELIRNPLTLPDFQSTILPFLLTLVVGLGIVAVLGVLVVKRVIVSNKLDSTKTE